MSYEELLEYLDIESAEEFIYFEAMADLIESDEYFEQELLYRLFDGADNASVSEILHDWFEELFNGLPDDSGEIFSLLQQINMCLEGLIMNAEDEGELRRFTDEFCRFRNWFSIESDVELLPEAGGEPRHQCLRDAVTTARIEKLDGEKFRYNFEDALEYELDSYTMSFADLVASEDEYNDGTIVFDEGDSEYGGNLAYDEDDTLN